MDWMWGYKRERERRIRKTFKLLAPAKTGSMTVERPGEHGRQDRFGVKLGKGKCPMITWGWKSAAQRKTVG
jgi:hypothetical protein